MEKTFLSMSAPNVLITGVKRAEDDSDLIVRFYELTGQPTQTAIDYAGFIRRESRPSI